LPELLMALVGREIDSQAPPTGVPDVARTVLFQAG